jgi:8-oxo-dGTP diphosphatase
MAGKSWDIGASGAVVHEGRVLMVRHTYGDKTGRWALPGGFARHDETLDQTALREVREETGLETEAMDVIGVRTRYTERGGAVFVLFRLRLLSGEAVADGVEVDRVGWFTVDEAAALPEDEVMALSRSALRSALHAGIGLAEDLNLPKKSHAYKAYLAPPEPGERLGSALP